MKFPDALMCIKRGDKLARQAWARPDGRRYLVFSDSMGAILDHVEGGGEAFAGRWQPDQTDILADDWAQVE